MEELYQIYLITNKETNKQYVGQVIQYRGYKVRFREHLCGIKTANTRLLSNSIKKHSAETFEVKLVEENIPESLIDEKEKYYIKYYNTFMPNGYNMTEGGQGVHGYKHSEKDREKLSQASKASWARLHADPERLKLRNEKVSKGLKGISRTIETREKLSIAAKKRFSNHHGTFYGKKHSEETKHKIALKNGHQVMMCDKIPGECIRTFSSVGEASRWLISNNKTKNKSAFTRIITICNHVKGQGKTAYGYIWEYLK